MEVLKNFASWDIFWSGGIEKFSPLGHILVWVYLSSDYKDFELYKVFMLN